MYMRHRRGSRSNVTSQAGLRNPACWKVVSQMKLKLGLQIDDKTLVRLILALAVLLAGIIAGK